MVKQVNSSSFRKEGSGRDGEKQGQENSERAGYAGVWGGRDSSLGKQKKHRVSVLTAIKKVGGPLEQPGLGVVTKFNECEWRRSEKLSLETK